MYKCKMQTADVKVKDKLHDVRIRRDKKDPRKRNKYIGIEDIHITIKWLQLAK